MKTRLSRLILISTASLLVISLFSTGAMAAGAAISAKDLKISSGKVQIDFLNDSTASISAKIGGGEWGDDGSYSWKDGEIGFNQGGNLTKIALRNNFKTARGITAGTPVKKLLAAYPAGYELMKTSDGPVYLYKVNINGMDCTVGFAVAAKSNKVVFALIEGEQASEEAASDSGDSDMPLQNSIGYYDGFTWGSVDQTEQLKVCKAIAIQFNNAGYAGFMDDEEVQKMWWVISKFYKDNGSNHGEFQKGLIEIVIEKFKIKDKAVLKKVRG